MIALAPVYLGAVVIWRGLFDLSSDNTVWNHLGLGAALLAIAAVLVGFVIRDARREAAQRREAPGPRHDLPGERPR